VVSGNLTDTVAMAALQSESWPKYYHGNTLGNKA